MMFRTMRRSAQALSKEETEAILTGCPTAVLALSGDGGYPYTVPVNHVYRDGKIYFHCAGEGHKIDAIRRNDKVCLCVIEKDDVVPHAFATDYRSAVVFGRAEIVADDKARRLALEALNEKLAPDYPEEGNLEIEKDWDRVCVVEITIEHAAGKCAGKATREAARKGPGERKND